MVGSTLRAAREKRGLTVKDIENETSMRGSVRGLTEDRKPEEDCPEAVQHTVAGGFSRRRTKSRNK